ncbi:ApeP family dehydratase [Francisella philomiragia]|uniref:ApeP family dehydratase n=1 Tax=Francisella philomiragia TaxID=28110 RepID=UPI001903DAE8|nr:beta-alanine--pyruvate aminotransferase [Francisella philomiragia]MBK2105966.1 beta-alanine--pyruvate aminotransferase [Francisella philomiragia]
MHNIGDLIPHKPPMRLVDEFIAFEDNAVHCRTIVTDGDIFFDKQLDGIPHWVAVEIMAQTAASYGRASKLASSNASTNEPPVAFLLSVRGYKTDVKRYETGSVLDIFAECIILDKGTGVFSCKVVLDQQEVASLTINAYQPQSFEDVKKVISREI